MIKWPVYIFFILILIPGLSVAKLIEINPVNTGNNISLSFEESLSNTTTITDTVRIRTSPGPNQQNHMDLIKKIKEIPKATNQAKPVKIETQPDTAANKKTKVKLPRQRRPDGMERPPEILRRNN